MYKEHQYLNAAVQPPSHPSHPEPVEGCSNRLNPLSVYYLILALGIALGVLGVVFSWIDSVSHWCVPLFVIGAALDILALHKLDDQAGGSDEKI